MSGELFFKVAASLAVAWLACDLFRRALRGSRKDADLGGAVFMIGAFACFAWGAIWL